MHNDNKYPYKKKYDNALKENSAIFKDYQTEALKALDYKNQLEQKDKILDEIKKMIIPEYVPDIWESGLRVIAEHEQKGIITDAEIQERNHYEDMLAIKSILQKGEKK